MKEQQQHPSPRFTWLWILFIAITPFLLNQCKKDEGMEAVASLAKITLEADLASIPADGQTEVAFTAKAYNAAGTELVDARVTLYANGDALPSNRFATDQAGVYHIVGRSGSVSSNEVVITATDPNDRTVATLELLATRDTLLANGADTLQFEVVARNAGGTLLDSVDYTIYVDDTPLEENVFATEEPGEYRITAKSGTVESDPLTVMAIDENRVAAVVLTASKNTLIADGVDSVAFSVDAYNLLGDPLSASGYTVYRDGERYEETRFATTDPGVYAFIAKLDGVESEIVTVTALEDETKIAVELELSSDADVIWADGTDKATFAVIAYNNLGDVIESPVYTLYANGSPLETNEFTATQARDYLIVAKSGTAVSNELVVTVAYEHTTTALRLVADKDTVMASGWEDVVSLAVFYQNAKGEDSRYADYYLYINDEFVGTSVEIYFTTEPGEYRLVAKSFDRTVSSNEVVIIAVEDPRRTVTELELHASAEAIIAGGSTPVEFNVVAYNTFGEVIDPGKVTLYVDDQEMAGTSFITDVVGEYHFQAKAANGVTSNTVVVVADVAPTVSKINLETSTQLVVGDGKAPVEIHVVLVDDKGRDIFEATYYQDLSFFANGQPLPVSPRPDTYTKRFALAEAGDYTITVKTGGITSNEANITARPNIPYALVTIPVVFHVGHFGEGIGTEANVSAAHIQKLLDEANLAFANGLNSQNPNAVDMRVRFRLAEFDEDGNKMPEKGVIRYNITQYDNGTEGHVPFNRRLALGEWSSWFEESVLHPAQYYNAWLYPFEEHYAGLGYYPVLPEGKEIPGIQRMPQYWFDQYRSSETAPLGLTPATLLDYFRADGRTLAHEIGHTMSLIHVFSENNCETSDFCPDTYSYRQNQPDNACPDNQGMYVRDNFMDYGGLQNTFTYDQRERVRHVLEHALWFPELVKSTK